MAFCSECGGETAAGVKFCSSCGANLDGTGGLALYQLVVR